MAALDAVIAHVREARSSELVLKMIDSGSVVGSSTDTAQLSLREFVASEISKPTTVYLFDALGCLDAASLRGALMPPAFGVP